MIDQLGDCFILGGDFNAHSPAWAYPDYNSLGEIVEEIMIENNLLLLNNGEATHLNKATGNWSAIDLTFSRGIKRRGGPVVRYRISNPRPRVRDPA